jgi:hypothetical protein
MGQTEISKRCYVKNGEWIVVDFACAKSCHVSILHNLSDMHRKPSAGFGLCLDRVPVVYQRTGQRLQTKRRCNPSLASSTSTDNSSWGSLTIHTHSLTWPWRTLGSSGAFPRKTPSWSSRNLSLWPLSVRGTPLGLSSFIFLTLFPFYSLLSILLCYILTGSISIDCDHYGHSHVM